MHYTQHASCAFLRDTFCIAFLCQRHTSPPYQSTVHVQTDAGLFFVFGIRRVFFFFNIIFQQPKKITAFLSSSGCPSRKWFSLEPYSRRFPFQIKFQGKQNIFRQQTLTRPFFKVWKETQGTVFVFYLNVYVTFFYLAKLSMILQQLNANAS